MNRIAAIHTGRRPPSLATLERRCSFVEDLNWPGALPGTPRKPVRPTEMWVPGRHGDWLEGAATLQ